MKKQTWTTLILSALVTTASLNAQTQTAPMQAPQKMSAQAPGYAPRVVPGVMTGQTNPQDLPPAFRGLDAAGQAKLDQDLADTANVAAQWLKLVDEGKFGDSWDYASKTFQFTIKRDEWIKAENEIRKPYGSIVSRKMVDQRTAKNPKGLPAGDYMVLIYQSSFSAHPEAGELLTMVRETDNKWRVLTYQAHY